MYNVQRVNQSKGIKRDFRNGIYIFSRCNFFYRNQKKGRGFLFNCIFIFFTLEPHYFKGIFSFSSSYNLNVNNSSMAAFNFFNNVYSNSYRYLKKLIRYIHLKTIFIKEGRTPQQYGIRGSLSTV